MTDWQTIRSGSILARAVSVGRRFLGQAASGSVILTRLGQGRRTLGQAVTHSRVGAVGRTLAMWGRKSWLYRWLTDEPTADLVVVDFRDTVILGSVFRLIDAVGAGLGVGLPRGDRLVSAFWDAPVRIVGIGLCLVVVCNVLLATLWGTLDGPGLGGQLLVLSGALLATRVDASWAAIRESAFGRLWKRLLWPPD